MSDLTGLHNVAQWNGIFFMKQAGKLVFSYDDDAHFDENVYIPFFLNNLPIIICKDIAIHRGDVGYDLLGEVTYVYTGREWKKLDNV